MKAALKIILPLLIFELDTPTVEQAMPTKDDSARAPPSAQLINSAMYCESGR
jgi:hypothetical protein